MQQIKLKLPYLASASYTLSLKKTFSTNAHLSSTLNALNTQQQGLKSHSQSIPTPCIDITAPKSVICLW